MKKESSPVKPAKTDATEKAKDKIPPEVPDADIEYEDTTHDDDNVQQSGSSKPSVPPNAE